MKNELKTEKYSSEHTDRNVAIQISFYIDDEVELNKEI